MHHPIWTHCAEVLAVVSTEGYLRDINPSGARVFGHDREVLTSRPYAEFVHPADARIAAATLERVRRGEPVQDFEHRLTRPEGEERVISWSAVPQGDVFYAVGRDVTEERARRLAERLDAIGGLSAGVAHDLNNLLTVILGGTESIERGLGRGEVALHFAPGVARMKNAVARGSRLASCLLAYAQLQPLRPAPTDVNEIAGRFGMSTRLRSGLRRALVDPVQLEMALGELIDNALEAGGAVTIATIEAESAVTVVVADTGRGMSDEVQQRACDPFFTTKEFGRGAGLGLSRALGFARQSGGDLQLESRPGRGTVARLSLPVAAT